MIMKRRDFVYITIFLLIPFMMPDSLTRISMIGNIVKLWKLMAGSVALLTCVKKGRFSLPLIFFSMFYLFITASSIINGQINIDWLMFLAFLWIIEISSASLNRLNVFLDVYTKLGVILIVANLISIIFYPKGLYATSVYELNWLLGYKNVIIRKTLPVLVAIIVKVILQDRKAKRWEIIGFLAGCSGVLLSQSTNGWLGVSAFLLLLLLIKMKRFPKWISLSKIFIGYTAVDIVIVNMDNIISRFEYLFVSVLGKFASMSGRVAIWRRTKELISHSFLIGYGCIDSSLYHFSFNVSHPHNLLLYYLMLGGILGIITFFIALLRVDRGRSLYEVEQTKLINLVFVASYISYFMMGIFESLVGATCFVPFMLLMYNINREVYKNDRVMHTI